MGEFKKLLVGALVLTFFGGMGAGAWVGSLAAAPQTAPTAESVEGRLADFQERIPGMTASQTRQLRTVLLQHDHAVNEIHQRINAEQFKKKLAQEAASRESIRRVLTEDQRAEYDKLTGRK